MPSLLPMTRTEHQLVSQSRVKDPPEAVSTVKRPTDCRSLCLKARSEGTELTLNLPVRALPMKLLRCHSSRQRSKRRARVRSAISFSSNQASLPLNQRTLRRPTRGLDKSKILLHSRRWRQLRRPTLASRPLRTPRCNRLLLLT